MFTWLMKRWRETQRQTDMHTLWPACKRYATSLDHAKAAFYMHAINDTAWTKDYDEEALMQFVDDMT